MELSKDAGYAKQDRAKAKNANEIEDYDRMENHDIKTLSVVNNMAESGMVTYKDDSGRLFLGDKEISKEQYMDMCYSIDGNLWKEYKKGKKRYKAASWILCSGSLCMLASSILFICDSYIAGGIFIGIGGVLAITSIPLYFKGNDLRVESVENYNVMKKAKSHTVASLDFGVSDAGVGLALRF